MPKSNKFVKALLPACGIVFGAGAGILVSVLCDIHIGAGTVSGAAAGLLISLIALNLFRK
ncbi:MAG TPA: hypothetical protein GXX75_10515 [Clostridiales bacterium]|nr:hypothetical protein [Clostridiales bacterium]